MRTTNLIYPAHDLRNYGTKTERQIIALPLHWGSSVLPCCCGQVTPHRSGYRGKCPHGSPQGQHDTRANFLLCLPACLPACLPSTVTQNCPLAGWRRAQEDQERTSDRANKLILRAVSTHLRFSPSRHTYTPRLALGKDSSPQKQPRAAQSRQMCGAHRAIQLRSAQTVNTWGGRDGPFARAGYNGMVAHGSWSQGQVQVQRKCPQAWLERLPARHGA